MATASHHFENIPPRYCRALNINKIKRLKKVYLHGTMLCLTRVIDTFFLPGLVKHSMTCKALQLLFLLIKFIMKSKFTYFGGLVFWKQTNPFYLKTGYIEFWSIFTFQKLIHRVLHQQYFFGSIFHKYFNICAGYKQTSVKPKLQVLNSILSKFVFYYLIMHCFEIMCLFIQNLYGSLHDEANIWTL